MTNKDIINMIYDTSAGTAPVVLQFGRVIENIVHHDSIVIKEAPPAIISKLIEAGCSIGVCEDGAYVYYI